MMLVALQLLFAPVAASIAGIAVWVFHRDESLDDGQLVRRFIFFLVMAGIGLYATLSSDSVRLRTDANYRIATEIDAHPLYDAFKRTSPDEAGRLAGDSVSGWLLRDVDRVLEARVGRAFAPDDEARVGLAS